MQNKYFDKESLTGRAIARKARGPGLESWLGCGGHFFLSPVVVLFLLSLLKLIYILAGPALFRGRLRVFRKCTDVVASSKGRLNLDSVRLIV